MNVHFYIYKFTTILSYFPPLKDTQDDLGEFERAVGVSLTDLKMPVLSVVIPVLNEEANIHAILTCIKEVCVVKTTSRPMTCISTKMFFNNTRGG